MSTTLARKFRVDLTADLTLASGWLQLNGIDDWNPNVNPTNEATDAYDTNGWSTSEVTMQAWSATASLFRRIAGGVYDPGQELARACMGQFGSSARLGVRWYDKNGGPEAYSGVALVGWARNNTAVANVEKATVTFTGTDVPLNLNITNPIIGGAVPLLAAATPTAQSVGKILTIIGAGFTGTSGASAVTIGGVNASSYTVQSDSMITAVVPTGSAGSAPVVVTNGVGPSAALAYTRGA